MKQISSNSFLKGKITCLIILLSFLAMMDTNVVASVTAEVEGGQVDGYLSSSNYPNHGSLRASSSFNDKKDFEPEGIVEKRSLGRSSSSSCDYRCPSHSRRKHGRKCYDTFDDCYCFHGYYKKHGHCRRKYSHYGHHTSSSSKSKKSSSYTYSSTSSSSSSDKHHSKKDHHKSSSSSDKHHSKKDHHKSSSSSDKHHSKKDHHKSSSS